MGGAAALLGTPELSHTGPAWQEDVVLVGSSWSVSHLVTSNTAWVTPAQSLPHHYLHELPLSSHDLLQQG